MWFCLWSVDVYVFFLWSVDVYVFCLWSVDVYVFCLWSVDVYVFCLWSVDVYMVCLWYVDVYIVNSSNKHKTLSANNRCLLTTQYNTNSYVTSSLSNITLMTS